MTGDAIDRPLSWPRLTVGIAAALFALAALLATGITADRATDSFIPRGHASFDNKARIQEIYNINDPLLVEVIAASGDVFTPEGLAVLQEVSREVEELDGVRHGSVRSLDTHDDIIPSQDGFDVRNFLDPFPQTIQAARRVRERVKAFPLYDGLLASLDGTSAGVVADFAQGADVLATFAALREMEERIALESDGAFSLRVSGPPIVTGTLNVYLNKDAMTLNPISALLTSALLFLCLRSLSGVLLPLTVMLPSITIAMAAMAVLGFPFNPFSNAVPVVILATSIADSVHLISGYYDRRMAAPAETREKALRYVIKDLRVPIIFTSVTTAAGFLLLCLSSPMIPVQQFGIVVTIGVLSALAFSLLLLPALILLFGIEPTAAYIRNYSTTGKPGRWPRFVEGFIRRFARGSAATLLLAGLVSAIALLGLPRLQADYEPAKFFPESSSVYEDYYAISDRFVGANFIEIDFNTGREGGVYDPDFLARLDRLKTEIEAWDVVGTALFIGDYLKKMNEAFNEGRPEFYRETGDEALNAQYFLLYTISGDPRRFDELTDETRSRANLRIFLKSGSYAETGAFVRWLEAEVAGRFSEETVMIGGETYVVFNWMESIFSQVLYSCLATLACMFVIAFGFTRSFVTSCLVVLPVAFGVALTYAYIGLVGIAVGLGTSIFASIAIGTGIDFAIQYLWAYRRESAVAGDHAAATRRVLMGVGKVIVFNALIIAGGFFVLILSQTTPPAHVGTFVAITILASLMTTFFVLVPGASLTRKTGQFAQNEDPLT